MSARIRTAVAVGAAIALGAGASGGATLDRAAVTRVFNTVALLPPASDPIPASVGAELRGQTALATGEGSRAELEFNDATIARLGANSIFSFERGTRTLELGEGVILLQVPKRAGGATINTAAVTAAVTGTTVFAEYTRPSKAAKKGKVKFIVLEGSMRLRLKGAGGESVVLSAGQMVSIDGGASRIGEPKTIDLGRLVGGSGLLGSEFSALPSTPLINDAIGQQQTLIKQGKLAVAGARADSKRKLSNIGAGAQAIVQASLRTDAIDKPGGKAKQIERRLPSRLASRPPRVAPQPPPRKPPVCKAPPPPPPPANLPPKPPKPPPPLPPPPPPPDIHGT